MRLRFVLRLGGGPEGEFAFEPLVEVLGGNTRMRS